MMVTVSAVIPQAVANEARESLNFAAAQARASGLLKPGITFRHLGWTEKSIIAIKEFEKNLNFEVLRGLGLTTIPNSVKENIQLVAPFEYGEALDKPVLYATSAPTYKAIGILALGTLQLPDIGSGGSTQISSGSVAYFRGDSSVVYRSCAGGRGILFYVKV